MTDFITFKVSGIWKLGKDLDKLEKAIQWDLLQATKKAGQIVVNDAKINAAKGGDNYPHKRTGNLIEHIKEYDAKIEDTKSIVEVGVKGVPYAARVEFGYRGPDSLGRTFHQPPRSYLRRALDENKETIREVIGNEMAGALKKYD